MKLLHATMRPGRVIEVLDSGNVKCSAPGLFSEEDIDVLPPVMPFFGGHANTFSQPKEGEEVWVLNVEDNPLQLFWFRKDDETRQDVNGEIMQEENVEILCNREAGTGYATIYFSDGTGWMFRNGESLINIRADGSIILNNSNVIIHLNGSKISLGSENESAHPVAFGDWTRQCINTIANTLNMIREAAKGTSMTAPIAAAIANMPQQIIDNAKNIPSNKVTAD